MSSMAEPNRNSLLRSIEDFESALAEFQVNNVVLAIPVLLQRFEEIETSAVTSQAARASMADARADIGRNTKPGAAFRSSDLVYSAELLAAYCPERHAHR